MPSAHSSGVVVTVQRRGLARSSAERIPIPTYPCRHGSKSTKMGTELYSAGFFQYLLWTIPLPASCKAAKNDHVCPSCKNDRCSKTEKSCWKCGAVL